LHPSLALNRKKYQTGLRLQEITLAELLKKNGYATGLVGKWNLGDEEGDHPYERGFDYSYYFSVHYQDMLMSLLTTVVISISIYPGLFLNYLHGRQEQVLRQFVKERMLLLIQAILHFHLPKKELISLKRIKHILFF
jgi:hypothetical protein